MKCITELNRAADTSKTNNQVVNSLHCHSLLYQHCMAVIKSHDIYCCFNHMSDVPDTDSFSHECYQLTIEVLIVCSNFSGCGWQHCSTWKTPLHSKTHRIARNFFEAGIHMMKHQLAKICSHKHFFLHKFHADNESNTVPSILRSSKLTESWPILS